MILRHRIKTRAVFVPPNKDNSADGKSRAATLAALYKKRLKDEYRK